MKLLFYDNEVLLIPVYYCCILFSLFLTFFRFIMGRFNKRLAAAKMVKADKKSLSSSAVLKTAAKKELEVPMLSLPAKMQIMHETASSLKPRKREIVKMNALSKVTKKDKMKIRKDHLQNRLKAIQMIKNEEKASVRRQRKAIVGDLKPFTDTLDKILDEDNSMKQTKAKKQPLKAKPVKQKQVKEQMLKDMSIFQQVLAHPEYNKNPLNTISTHIENKMLMEAMDD